MKSSIDTQSIQSPSIFSRPESCLSAETQWSSEGSIKLGIGRDAFDGNGVQKHSKQMGRPPNNWTCSRLRKLTRLYLLTDFELDGIVSLLRTEDFQPCKRNVQEKLNLLLQPQPNKIRPKGGTKVLRKLLLECAHLQTTRRIRRQQQKNQLEHRRHSQEANTFSTSFVATDINSSCTPNSDPGIVDILDHEERFISHESLGAEAIVPISLLREEKDNIYQALTPTFDFELPVAQSIHTGFNLTPQTVDWHLVDFGLQEQYSVNDLLEEESSYSINYPSSMMNICDEDEDLQNSFWDAGFGSDFGPKTAHLLPDPVIIPPVQDSSADLNTGIAINDILLFIDEPDNEPFAASSNHLSAPGRCQMVNSNYMRDNLDTASSIPYDAYSCNDFDFVDACGLEDGPSSFNISDQPTQAECSSAQELFPHSEDAIIAMERLSISKISPSNSKISTFWSKSLFSQSSSSIGRPQSPTPTDSSADEVECQIKLPGVFPEYCLQHINHNKLRRCNHWVGPEKCNSKHYLNGAPTHRSLRPDVRSRIFQRTIQEADIHELDSFGNSVIHISATMLAPPNYLVSLIRLGANVNILNNAGQTFLHLVKPEVLDQCEDFFDLLEILSVQGFNFSQCDHLGQSPLHLLTRPWIRPDILRKIITKLDTLPIHRHLSTARDCLGHTVVAQMNLFATQSYGTDLDQAILSLACETDNHIVDPKDLQKKKYKPRYKNSSDKSKHPASNYENHPAIETVDDLFKYEQHIDYWRIIVAAKHSPWFEDLNGRNGLHCLAEASLVSTDMPLPSQLLDQLTSLREAAHTVKSDEREHLIKALLNVGVDPNNYDNEGNTPLMAFIIHRRAAESEESTTRMLSHMLDAGSDTNRRNRRGETALHLAVKLGHRAATKVLLASGANVHARTGTGLGVLELGQKHAANSKQDEKLYAQIMLCMSLAASFGAVSEPTILDEWGSPQLRLASSSSTEPKGFKLIRKLIGKKLHGRRKD